MNNHTRRAGTSLRAVILATTAGASLLGLVSAAALLLLVGQASRTADRLLVYDRSMDAAEGIRHALLVVNRERFLARVNPAEPEHAVLARAQEEKLRRSIEQAEKNVQSAEEAEVLRHIERSIEAVIASLAESGGHEPVEAYRRTSEVLDGALATTDEYVSINRAQAAEALRQFDRWRRILFVGGTAIALLLPLLAVGIVLAMRRAIYRPFREVGAAISRYAAGDRTARAPEIGLRELRTIAGQFDEMADALETQRQQQLTFLSAVAHDLRNPLAALRTTAALAKRDLEKAPDRIEARLDMVQRQVDRLNRMVGDLLDVTRVEAGRLELKRERADLCETARDVAHLFDGASDKHTLEVELPPEPVCVDHDPVRIGQVLTNLVSNAIKYSPEGGPVRLSLRPGAKRVTICVADQGLGLSAEDRRLLFQPFRRAAAVKDAIPGVGLGLSVSQKLVQAHGGTIEVESEPGKGSTFCVILPHA